MAYIKIDTDKMQTVINNVIDYSHAVDGARSAIRRSSEYHHDPVESVVTDTESLPLALAPAPGNKTMWAYVMRLRDLAEELRSRRQEAIDINESGITMANPDGTLSYYLPDPPPGTQDEAAYWRSMDTVDNVHAYNTGSVETAKAEAAELQEALANGTSSQGRTPEQILDQIDKHRDIPTYSLAFCQTMGVDSMLDAPLEAQKDTNYAQESQPAIIDRMVDTFGHIMCAASTLYDAASYQPSASSPSSPHQYSLASAIYNAVTDKGHEGRATVLDAYLTADGTVYDADFLVGLAELMETIEDWPAEPKGVRWSGQYGTDDYGNKYLPDHTTDPLAAVLNGMARNTEASLAYLAPDDWDTEDGVWLPSEKSKKRMEMLANRVWTDLSMEGLSGVFAAASASRSPSGQAAGSNQANEVSQRATWATANGITILEAQGLPNFGQTKHNVGIMLGNCGRELIGIATNGSISPGESPAFPGTQITLAGSDEESLKNAIAHLLYEVSDSSEANYEIARGTTAYTASRTSTYMTENDPSISAIQAFYKQQADVMNLLALLGQEKADNAYNGAMAASSLLSLVPGLGTPATLASAGLTLSGAPQVDVTRHAGDTGLLGAAYTNAFNAGLINNPPDPNTTSWYSVDPNGSQRVTLETDEQVADFNTWISTGAGDTPDAMNNLTNSSIAMGTQNWSDPDAFKDAYGGEDW